MAVTKDSVQQLYIAYYGRPADPSGLDYWTGRANAEGLNAVVNAFGNSEEATNLYGSLTVQARVNKLYQNMFGRDADVDGLNFYTGKVLDGTYTLASLAKHILDGVNPDVPESKADGDTLAKKLAAANAFTAGLDTTAEILKYDEASEVTQGVSFLNGVTSATTDEEIVSQVEAATAGLTSSEANKTYTLTADAPAVTEGNSGTKVLTFTLTLDKAPTAAVTINYQTLTSGTAAAGDDFLTAAGTVTFAAGQTSATVSVTVNADTTFEANETVEIKFSGDKLAAEVTASGTITNDDVLAQNFTLTKGLDILTGTTGDDTYTGSVDSVNADLNTASPIDSIDGGAGIDTVKISAATALSGVPKLSNVEVLTVDGASTVNLNVSSVSALTNLNVTKGTTVTLTASATADVAASGATGAITIDGGKDISVSDANTDEDITIGDTTVSTGNITVTDTKQGSGVIQIDGGKNVTVTATAGTAAIKVGDGAAAADKPTGTVSVTANSQTDAIADASMGAITAKGGSTITVTQVASSTAAATDLTKAVITQGDVTVVGGDATTSVTVNQTASNLGKNAVTAVAAKAETSSVKFGVLKNGDVLTVAGLTLTAAADMTANEVAAAFANLVNGTVPATGDTQSGAAASKGVYTNNTSGWTSGAANGDTVVFTSTATGNVAAISINLTNTSTNSVIPVATPTDGVSEVKAVTGVLGVKNGTVLIDDNATASITTVTVDGYGNTSMIGNTTTLSKLTDLSLANSGSTGTEGETDASMTVDAVGVTSLNLTVNAIKGTVSLDGGGAELKSLNLKTAGADSEFALTAAAVETLAVSGDKAVSLTADLAALKTVTVTGSAGLTLAAAVANTVTSVDTTATTGTVKVSIDGTQATYTGGAGVDDVTLTTTAPTKAISLGAGNDSLTLAAGTTTSTANLSGGAGTDTLVMDAADAVTASASAAFEAKIDGFEKLSLNKVAANSTIDLANLDDINYVVVNAGTNVNITETTVVTFQNLTAGQSVTIAGRTVTVDSIASATAAQIATVFAGGTVTGLTASGALTGWTAASSSSGNTVTFTSTTANSDVAAIAISDTALAAATAGTAGTPADGGVGAESTSWTMSGLTNGQSYTLAGLTVTAQKTLTAAEVAGAFTAGATSAGNFTVTGTLSSPSGWTLAGMAFSNIGSTLTLTNGVAGDVTNFIAAPLANTAGTSPTDATANPSNGQTGVTLTLNNMANNGTLELNNNSHAAVVTFADATGATDVFNIALNSTGNLTAGTVTVANVETINISSLDTETGASPTKNVNTLTLTADKATAVNLTGANDLTLTLTGSTKVTSIDGSALTGKLTVTSLNTTSATTIKGGSANDVLTAATGTTADVLIGGAGDDTLTANAGLTTLTGGAGNDLFVINTASLNSSSYATITDFAAGDLIKIDGIGAFKNTKITQGDTAVFQDYANAAVNALGANEAVWFQFGGNTYIVADMGADTATFTNSQDFVVKLTGLVDLSNASFNNTTDTIAL